MSTIDFREQFHENAARELLLAHDLRRMRLSSRAQ
jgi:hypothetical protein